MSLNLRYTEQGVIMLFEKQLPKYKPLPFNPPRKVISFQSVFIMSENIPFLREFFLYHLKMGISRFFLYDNEGQVSDKISKYKVSLSCIVS